MPVTIRSECTADEAAIAEVTRLAFASNPRSSHSEQFIVRALRNANALSVSLVAQTAGRVVGHIAFSPVAVSDGALNWYGLGPVSVLPEAQGLGTGRALIDQGLASLRALGAQGCVVLGEPLLYGRFGFVHDPALVLQGVRQAFFLSLSFGPISARGEVTYHAGFSAVS